MDSQEYHSIFSTLYKKGGLRLLDGILLLISFCSAVKVVDTVRIRAVVVVDAVDSEIVVECAMKNWHFLSCIFG